MLSVIYKAYAYVFGRGIFRKINMFLYQLSLRGLGIMDCEGSSRGETSFLNKYLQSKTKPIVFDIGANIGNYTKDIIKANQSSQIYSFEPHPKTFKIFVEKTKSLGNVYAYNLAVGSKKTELKLYDYEGNRDGSPHASLHQGVVTEIHKAKAIEHTVTVISLDDFVSENDIESIDLLKIDTEGNELEALKGCTNLLALNKIKAIQFEFNEMNIISKSTFKDFWDILNEKYDLYRILDKNSMLKIDKYSPLINEIYGFKNIIALMKDK